MSWWNPLSWKGADELPNANTPGVPPASVGMIDYSPGDPLGLEIIEAEPSNRGMTVFAASGWDGWPADWNMPLLDFDMGSRFNELVDIAWACLDLNSRVLATMPVYKMRGGEIIEPSTWMTNPDPTIYTSWIEFAKQLFWDYMLGEAFVLPIARGRDGWPLTFRVMPPWTIDVQMEGGRRVYRLGGPTGDDVTGEILHIRYKSSTDQPRGVGPLEAAGGRMLTARVLAQYIRNVAATGGLVNQTLETDVKLNGTKAQQLVDDFMAAKVANLGAPTVLDDGLSLVDHQHMSPRDMAMLEIAEFTEARICVLLGAPPFGMALPAGDNNTYANVTQVFDFHDRTSLRPKAADVMAAMSGWVLPRGTTLELNRDEYTRPPFAERVTAWATLFNIVDPVTGERAISIEEIRAAERLIGQTPTAASVALTGGQV